MNRIALWSTCAIVLLPSTLAVSTVTLFVLRCFSGAVSGPDTAISEWHLYESILPALIGAGCIGIATLWQLFVGLLRGRPPRNRRLAWAGLAAGSAASLYLIFASWEALATLVFGWPLLAVLHFGSEFSKTSSSMKRRGNAS